MAHDLRRLCARLPLPHHDSFAADVNAFTPRERVVDRRLKRVHRAGDAFVHRLRRLSALGLAASAYGPRRRLRPTRVPCSVQRGTYCVALRPIKRPRPRKGAASEKSSQRSATRLGHVMARWCLLPQRRAALRDWSLSSTATSIGRPGFATLVVPSEAVASRHGRPSSPGMFLIAPGQMTSCSTRRTYSSWSAS